MKARITKTEDCYKVLFCTGLVHDYDIKEIKNFISDFRNEKYYKISQKIRFLVNYDDLDGETVAYVNDEYELCIVNDSLFKTILNYNSFNYITAADYAKMHNKSESIVKRHCRERRIPGVKNIGSLWLIPEDAEYPADARVGKRVKPLY